MTAEKKCALIIANSHYEDAMLRQLVAPSQDADALAQVLSDPAICGFQARTLLDEPSYRVCEEIETFFDERERDDLTLLYFSGHGITDDDGLLYYAARNTQRKRLRSTGVAAAWVNQLMSCCRSRRQVLLLDCCHAGAFARTKSAATVNVGQQLAADAREEGRGRFVLTASDAFQYSFEGDKVEGQGVYSVFTRALVEGLRSGQADLDNDGLITLDELYRFVQRRVREQTPQQSPRRWESDAEGQVVIGVNPRPAEAALPDDLVNIMLNLIPEARETAIPRLDALLRGKHRGLALAAERALMKLAEDDSRRVSNAAQRCLDDYQRSVPAVIGSPTPVAKPEPSAKPAVPAIEVPVPIPAPAEVHAETVQDPVIAEPVQPDLQPSLDAAEEIKGQHASARESAAPEVGTLTPTTLKESAAQTLAVEIEPVPSSTVEPEGLEWEADHVAEVAPIAKPQGSHADTVSEPSFLLESTSVVAAESRQQRESGNRVVARWGSLPPMARILVCSFAVGIVWMLIEYADSTLTPATDMWAIMDLVSVAASGYVLAWALYLSVPRLTRSQRRGITVAWVIASCVQMMFTFDSFFEHVWGRMQAALYTTFQGSEQPGFLLVPLCLTLPLIAAGAFTGGIVAAATGKSPTRGWTVGGASILVAVFIRWACVSEMLGKYLIGEGIIIGFMIHRADWRALTTGLFVPLSAFIEGAIAVAGMLWLLREQGQPQPASDSAG